MLEIFISLLGSANTINHYYNNISGIFLSKDHIEPLDRIVSGIERLSDNILYAPNLETVQDITRNRQRKISNFREIKESLEPLQKAIGSEILSSAIILTPEKMQIAMQANPWEVLLDIRPINLSNPPDMIPIIFQHDTVQYIGWQIRGSLPMLFDCRYNELLVPETQVKTSYNQMKPGDIFRNRLKDGSDGPEMVVIPTGKFRMGDIQRTGYNNEQPVHEVSVERFAIGRYPVTVYEFKQFVNATGYKTEAEKGHETDVLKDSYLDKIKDVNWRNPYFSQTDNHPVVCVTWNDALDYIEWLSEQTGQQYRLPTEAEWEYAARAGTETDYWWGNDFDESKANLYINSTYPVGCYEPNSFGLYDTVGNVSEWTCSKYKPRYQGLEKKCATEAGRIVVRGGAWGDISEELRSAFRERCTPNDICSDNGFRLAMRL